VLPAARYVAGRPCVGVSNRTDDLLGLESGESTMTTLVTQNESKQEQNSMTNVEQTREGMTFTPRFDIWETEDELLLYGDLPGVKAEDLDIQFEHNQLVVHGRVSPRHENQTFLYSEYGIGDFHRSFTIGESIDASKISAEITGGVLTLHLPKSDAIKPRRIAVKTS
jgi:HSP20 family molecular chaperone IbpA